ncbi:MAG: hypothetical protein ACETV0_08725 [Nitrososphaeria archaeon]
MGWFSVLDMDSLKKLVGKMVVVKRPFRGKCSGELRSVSETFLFLYCDGQSVILDARQEGLSVRPIARSRRISDRLQAGGAAAKRRHIKADNASMDRTLGAG